MQLLAYLAPALGGAILCFLWQGVLIALGCAALLSLTPKHLADRRYAIACGALLVSLLSFLVSLGWLAQSPSFMGDVATGEFALAASFLFAPLGESSSLFEALLHSAEITSQLAWLWSAGVAAMSLRLLRSWRASNRLRRSGSADVPHAWRTYFERLRDEFGISASVRLLQTTLVAAPMVVGFLVPVVLVPVSAFSRLSSEQLRLILRHELAHIRRFDHLVNMAQCAVETLLFFHPATWWISSQIRREREFCCDQAAVAASSDRRHLAEALTQLEQARLSDSSTILSAHGGPLMIRIRRILNAPLGQKPNVLPGRTLGLSAGALALVLGSFAQTSFSSPGSEGSMAPAVAESALVDDDKAITVETYRKAAARVEVKVKTGEMTRETGDKILVRLRERIVKSGERRERTRAPKDSPAVTMEDVKKAAAKLDKLVAAGVVTRADADKRLGQMKRRLKSSDTPSFTLEDVKKAAADLDKLVDAGTVTRADADKRLGRMKSLLKSKEVRTFTLEDVKKAAAELDKLVDAGVVSRADADRRLGGMKRMLKKSSSLDAKTITMGEFKKISTEIKALVKSGKLTPEEAGTKFLALRKMVRVDSDND